MFTQARDRLDEHVPLRANFALTAAYTRMIRGFGGHPKFSKSLPGSAIDVTTPPGEVRRLLTAEPAVPEESATYQLMCQLPNYDATTLVDLYDHCCEADRAWQRAVNDLADQVNDLINKWPG